MAIQDPKDHDLRHEARRGGESPAVPAESEPQRYRQGCPKGGECLNGCLSRHPCMYDLPAAPSLPARGSAELHAELAPPPGMGEQIMANLASVAVGAVSKAEQTARTELAERRRDERAAGFGCLRAAIVEARKVIDDAGPHEDPMCEVVRILDDALVATDAPAPAERPAEGARNRTALKALYNARDKLGHYVDTTGPERDAYTGVCDAIAMLAAAERPAVWRRDNRAAAIRRWSTVMLEKLDANKHKGDHWGDDDPRDLFARVEQELAELAEALSGMDGAKVYREAADVANMVMMVADSAAPNGRMTQPYPLAAAERPQDAPRSEPAAGVSIGRPAVPGWYWAIHEKGKQWAALKVVDYPDHGGLHVEYADTNEQGDIPLDEFTAEGWTWGPSIPVPGEPAAGGDAPTITVDPASVAAEIAAQDAQIAALSLRLAELEQGRETLLAALGRAAEDLREHQGAWRGLCQVGRLDRTTHGLAQGWWSHAERSAKRVESTVAIARAGGDEG